MAPSLWQLIIVLVIVLLLFGTKRLRSIGGDLGTAIRGFKNGLKDDDQKKDDSAENEEDDTIDVKAEKVEQEK